MNGATRFGIGSAVVALGVAAGIGMTAVLGGSTGEDPCQGTGRVDRKIIGPASEGSKEYIVCKQLGHEVIFDPQGTPVSETLREEEIIEYYKTHPAENPRVIADETADAYFAVNAFEKIQLPAPAAEDCPKNVSRVAFPRVGVSLCMPLEWRVLTDDPQSIDIGTDLVIVGYFSMDVTDTVGTRCAEPQAIEIRSGLAQVCAFKEALGGRGHGIKLESGRGGGLSFTQPVSDADRELGYEVLFSVEELAQ